MIAMFIPFFWNPIFNNFGLFFSSYLDFGENGYFKIERGVNLCGCEMITSYGEVL